ncbi:MAG: putative lipid II flippase FtsW, partial [Clostridiales bacterium]|nr:putative lipid II flippase FtsW [Clostridiales bacterium]
MAADNMVSYRRRAEQSAAEHPREKKDENVIAVSEYDSVIFFSVLILVFFGIIMIFSSSYYVAARNNDNMFYFLVKQGTAVLIGFFAMLVMAVMNYNKFLRRFSFPLYLVANVLLVYVRLFGRKINGAYRWIDVPIFGSVQPSEIAKVAVIILLAAFISADKSRAKTLRGLIVCAVILIIPIGLVFWGKNLSTALIIAAIGAGMVFVSSPYTWRFILMGAGGVAALISYLAFGDSFRAGRFAVWLDPFIDPMDKGFQTIQSLFAVASGGLFGLGLGQSNQKLQYMPEPHNDFIFAVICEELGFFGAMIVLILFAILLWRGMRVALNAQDLFGMLLATGIVVMLGVQVIINVAVVTNTIPNTGIPMPFISYGG